MEQRFTFDKIASLYDAARPDYSEALFGDIAGMADLAPDDAILEIGCGTGRATQGLARLGGPILALDPGPALLEVARARLADFANVRFAEATFEDWPLAPAAFKLVAAAQKLALGGAAGAFRQSGGSAESGRLSRRVRQCVDAARSSARAGARSSLCALRAAPPRIGAGDWYCPGGSSRKCLPQSAVIGAGDAESLSVDPPTRRGGLRRAAAHQIGLPMLETAARDTLTAAVAETIDAHGGAFDAGYEAHLYVARRL